MNSRSPFGFAQGRLSASVGTTKGRAALPFKFDAAEDKRQVPPLRYLGFPVELGGVVVLLAPFFTEGRTRGLASAAWQEIRVRSGRVTLVSGTDKERVEAVFIPLMGRDAEGLIRNRLHTPPLLAHETRPLGSKGRRSKGGGIPAGGFVAGRFPIQEKRSLGDYRENYICCFLGPNHSVSFLECVAGMTGLEPATSALVLVQKIFSTLNTILSPSGRFLARSS
jgi:hypothetical protein